MNAAMARAMLKGRNYTLPDDVQFMALPVLAHRIVLSLEAAQENDTPEDLIQLIIQSIKVPGIS
jgi:MoxR-like ATPase